MFHLLIKIVHCNKNTCNERFLIRLIVERCVLYHIYQKLMQAQVFIEFRMEGCGYLISLTCSNNMTIDDSYRATIIC